LEADGQLAELKPKKDESVRSCRFRIVKFAGRNKFVVDGIEILDGLNSELVLFISSNATP
jgi:hypothetical protein